MNRSKYSSEHHFFGSSTPQQLIEEFGSPLYVYNEGLLRKCCREMRDLIRHPRFRASYSTKANGNPHLLRIIKEEGLTADAMSPGELAVLQMAGFSKKNIHYVCNNVTVDELRLAVENASYVSVDSLSQLETFGQAMPGGEVMVRLNPGVGAGHHQKVVTAGKNTKFGVSAEDLPGMADILQKYNLTLVGLNQHVGSLFLEGDAYLAAAAWLLQTAAAYPTLRVIDFGGGFGIPYQKYDEQARLDLERFGKQLTDMVDAWVTATGYQGIFVTEPGRYVVAESGLLLGQALAVKNNGPVRYVGSDLGFSVIIRPVLYDAFHDIEVYPADSGKRNSCVQTIVGNICETGDVVAKDRLLPEIAVGDVIGVLDAGAYCSSMASNYNQRFRPAEILIGMDGTPRLIRRRDTLAEILAPYDV